MADLLGGLGFRVIETTGRLAFTSDEMRGCVTAAEVFDLAKRLRAAMTGQASIDEDFQLGSVVDFSSDPPKRHALLEAQSAVISVSTGQATLTVGPPRGLTASEMEAWKRQQEERDYEVALENQRAKLEPAFRNDKAAKVLGLLAQDKPTGETLNKIYELAEGHPTNRLAFHARFSVSPEEFRRFQDAVHNPAISGDWARHAYMDTPRSDSPMTRREAEQFVRRIARQWLDRMRKSGCGG